MKILICFLTAFLALSCASKKVAKYEEEKTPKFLNARSFVEPPERVKTAARAVLDSLVKASDPITTDTIHENADSLQTGWVYGKSRDKYINYDINGALKRKILNVRRKISFTIAQSFAATEVTVKIDEEIEKVDLKTGKTNGWSTVSPDSKVYDDLLSKLQTQVRAMP